MAVPANNDGYLKTKDGLTDESSVNVINTISPTSWKAEDYGNIKTSYLCPHKPLTPAKAIAAARIFLNWYAGKSRASSNVVLSILLMNAVFKVERTTPVLPLHKFIGNTEASLQDAIVIPEFIEQQAETSNEYDFIDD